MLRGKVAWKLGSLGDNRSSAEIDEYKERFRERWLKEGGIDSFFVKTDVSDEEQVRRMVSEAVRRYGKIDILVSNAGIGISPKEVFDQSTEE